MAVEKYENKLKEVEVAIELFRRRLLSIQSLRVILIDLYNLLEQEEKGEKTTEEIT